MNFEESASSVMGLMSIPISFPGGDQAWKSTEQIVKTRRWQLHQENSQFGTERDRAPAEVASAPAALRLRKTLQSEQQDHQNRKPR